MTRYIAAIYFYLLYHYCIVLSHLNCQFLVGVLYQRFYFGVLSRQIYLSANFVQGCSHSIYFLSTPSVATSSSSSVSSTRALAVWPLWQFYSSLLHFFSHILLSFICFVGFLVTMLLFKDCISSVLPCYHERWTRFNINGRPIRPRLIFRQYSSCCNYRTIGTCALCLRSGLDGSTFPISNASTSIWDVTMFFLIVIHHS